MSAAKEPSKYGEDIIKGLGFPTDQQDIKKNE
jgi:hypothetical protein